MTTDISELTSPQVSLVASYRALGGVSGWDECLAPDGNLRAPWRSFFDHVGQLSVPDLIARDTKLDARVVELGLAHDIFSDPNDDEPGWDVNLIPLIFGADEWVGLSAAIEQRLRLADALVADLYGPKVSLRQRHLPADIVLSDPNFLRACEGIQPPSGHVHFLAADIARRADGSWALIDTHTETLAGLGYALANRLVYTHAAEDAFSATPAVRLAPFFRDMAASFAVAGEQGDTPRVALLTPGPTHADYFSHAYIARYLNVLLVEGGDMRTVSDRLYLKTLEGLKPIDLLIRCVEGLKSDAMELDPGGFDGPVGLVQACRKQPDLVRNSLGSAVVQNRAIGAYLPEVCRTLLGEELLMSDTPRRWLGGTDPVAALQGVGPGAVIRRVQDGTGRPGENEPGVHFDELDAAQQQDLIAQWRFNGASYVAEAPIQLSHAPTFVAGHMTSEPIVVRLFAAMTETGPKVMPGGLAITVGKENQVGQDAVRGRTRDVWVLGDNQNPLAHQSLWRTTTEKARVQRSQRSLQSRVADDLFWLGRYAERADWTMRVLRSSLSRELGDDGQLRTDGEAQATLEPARRAMTLLLSKPVAPSQPVVFDADRDSLRRLADILIHDRRGLHALASTLDLVVRSSELTRDRLSLEAWHVLASLRANKPWRRMLDTASPAVLVDLLEDGLAIIGSFNGLMHENMTRNHGWTFLAMGRRLERAYNLSDIMLALFKEPESIELDRSSMVFLLEVADSYITYRSRYRLDPLFPFVLDLLLLDESNPRSLVFQLDRIGSHLETLPLAQMATGRTEEQRLVLDATTRLQLVDAVDIASGGTRDAFRALLEAQLEFIPEVSSGIARRYFSLLEEKPHRVFTRRFAGL
ncbi:MAG: circularly permuted type 2 ATP-grasp protein [Pseudomonadota bacterium]